MSAPDVLVVGAGITGASAALSLAEAGARVTLLDAYGPAAMASGWTLAGVRQSGRHPAELPLARAAVDLWPELDQRLGGTTNYRQNGNLRLARDEREAQTIRSLVAEQRAAGLDLSLLEDPREIAEVAPCLSNAVVVASHCPTDGHADPVATVRAYTDAAERAGAELVFGERVEHVHVKRGRALTVTTSRRTRPVGGVLLACGINTNALLQPLGANIPMTTPLVTVVRTASVPPLLRPVLGVANADLAMRQEVGGALRFTSGAQACRRPLEEVAGRPVARPDVGRLAETIARVTDVLPAVREAPLDAVWGGLLDLTPDALPVIDRVPGVDNLVVAAGFSGHGFGIGPVTGPLVAALALGISPAHPLDPFAFTRFASAAAPADAPLALHG